MGRRHNLKSLVVVLFLYVSRQRSFESMGGINVTDVRRERIPLHVFVCVCSSMGDTKYQCV